MKWGYIQEVVLLGISEMGTW